MNGWSERPDEDLEHAFEFAKRADEIDDRDSRTQIALGMAYLFHANLDKAKHHFEAALRLNPNDTRVFVYYSCHAVFDGDVERAVELSRQALTLNLYGKYNWNLGLASYMARDYADAAALLESIRNPPATVLALLAASYAMLGDGDRARSAYWQFTDAAKQSPVMKNLQNPTEWQEYYAARWPFRDASELEHLIDGLRKSGLPI